MKTTADIPSSVAAEYGKQSPGMAKAQASGDGYAKPPKVKTGSTTGAPKGQYGLPKSGKRSVVRM